MLAMESGVLADAAKKLIDINEHSFLLKKKHPYLGDLYWLPVSHINIGSAHPLIGQLHHVLQGHKLGIAGQGASELRDVPGAVVQVPPGHVPTSRGIAKEEIVLAGDGSVWVCGYSYASMAQGHRYNICIRVHC